MTKSWLDANRAMWDDRAPAHAASADYEFTRFIDDPNHLSSVVRFDQPRLGDIAGLKTVHLQCHIGTDTLSLHRLGAKVTGLDLSPVSLREARRLAAETGSDIEYVESDVYSAATKLAAGTFDLVYTGIGAICWLPDLDKWAATVAALLKPGGRLFIRDMHPMLGGMEVVDGRVERPYPYFRQPEPLVFTDTQTYVETDTELKALPGHEWAHSIGEVVQAALDHDLVVTSLAEHDSVPWNALPGHMSLDAEAGEWRMSDHPERVAASFTLTATRA